MIGQDEFEFSQNRSGSVWILYFAFLIFPQKPLPHILINQKHSRLFYSKVKSLRAPSRYPTEYCINHVFWRSLVRWP